MAGNPSQEAGQAAAHDSPRETRTVTVLATGDVIAHDAIFQSAWDSKAGQYDFSDIFDEVRAYVQGFDVAAVSQETILVHDRALVGGYPEFGTPESLGDALASSGFDVVCAATNHANDRGEQGIADTLSFWASRYPSVTLLGLHDSPEDAASIDVVECKGIRIALFDYTESLNGHALPAGREFEIDTLNDEAKLLDDLRRAEDEADISICFLHIGEEYADAPTAAQRALCERLVDAGADAVICSHPHVLQPAELLHSDSGAEGVVFWSLGNFVAWQTDPRTALGAFATLTIETPDEDETPRDGKASNPAASSGDARASNASAASVEGQAPDNAAAFSNASPRDGGFSATAKRKARITSFALVPTVCHLEPSLARPYLLENYTEELAARHYFNTAPDSDPAAWQRALKAHGRSANST